jgi:transposase
MSHEIKADYNQSFILPPSLEDWLPDDHPARFIRYFVEQLDLSELGFREHACKDGRSPYSNDLKLKVWLYGYFHKIRSLRGLESACYNHIGMIWLTGMNRPDHSTLGNFWRDNKQAIVNLFKESTRTAQKADLIGLVLQALDGTKIKADVCDSKGWHSKSLKKALKELDKGVEEVVDMIESSIQTEEPSYHLPDDYKERVRAELEQSLREIEEIDRKHLHPIDKDARMMKHGKGKSFGFNAQAVVDDKNGLIVAEDVTNDENDTKMLAPMIDEVEENLGDKADETVADAGFYSPDQLLEAEEKGHDVLVNLGENIAPKNADKPFHKSKFTCDKEKDVFICPLGKELRYERTRKSRKDRYLERVYRCKSFKDCPERDACSCEKQGRKITMGPHHQVLQRQIQKQKEPGNKELLAKRKQIVEPVFGIIKEIYGFRRFTVRGLENVRTQWSLVCTTFNLRKLFKHWTAGKLVIGG